MKKIFTLLAAVIFSTTVSMATVFTFTDEASLSQTKDGFTVKIEKGSSNNAPAIYANGLRLYASNTITVSGNGLTNISITFAKQGQKDYATLSASSGSLVSGGVSTSDDNLVTDTWTGSGNSVTFTLGSSGQRLIKQLVVNGDGSETPSNPDDPSNPSNPDTPGALDPDFKYMEPTIVNVPSLTVQGDAYTFIDNNIQVSCTKGAVNDTYFSAHAGFDMTFTATKPIKGIVINGFVKKDFTATTNHGNISYLTPGADIEANPVVVLTDVNSTSVTISCVKQLRCYNVEVYFDANPDATVNGGSTGGGNGSGDTPGTTVTLNYDTAEAVYESEYVEMIGEENYSIFLYNWDDYDPYFALDIYPASKDVLTGTYSWDDYTLGDYCYYVYGAGDEDMTWVEGGSVTISKSGNIYTIKGTLLCDNGVTYNINFSGEMPIYTDDEYYGDGDDDDSGVDAVAPEEGQNADAPMYDLQGNRVAKGYRGIVIQNRRKHIER